MSENNTTATVGNSAPKQTLEEIIAASPFATPFTVTRNGVSQVAEIFVGKRGVWENHPYVAIQITTDPAKEILHDHAFLKTLELIGKDNIKNYINTIMRRVGQDLVEDSIGIDGMLSLDLLHKNWANLAAAGLKLAELRELVTDEVKKYTDYTSSKEFEDILMNGSEADRKALKEVVYKKNSTLKALKAEMEIRSNRRSKEAQTETVTPE